MRILHVISTLDPERGGVAEALRVMVHNAPEGLSNEVVSLDAPGAAFLGKFGGVVHALGPGKGVYAFAPALEPWLRANRDRFDGVVVHGLWQSCGRAVWRTMRGHVPYAVFPHGMLDPYFKRAFPAKHLKKWLYWLPVEYWVLRGARRVLFTCEAERDLAAKSFWLHRWRAEVVPFGTLAPAGDAHAQREAFYLVCPAVRGCRTLLFLGRIHPKKGCDLLVEAFARVAERDPELQLVMAGPDAQDWRAELMRSPAAAAVAARIHWVGMLEGDAKWGAFYAAEAFALPSHQENFGIAVVEAMACGRPVLVSDKVNIAREIGDDGAGLVGDDTAEGTLWLLQRWMELPEERRVAMGVAALECFQRRYEMRENARMVARLFTADGP